MCSDAKRSYVLYNSDNPLKIISFCKAYDLMQATTIFAETDTDMYLALGLINKLKIQAI